MKIGKMEGSEINKITITNVELPSCFIDTSKCNINYSI